MLFNSYAFIFLFLPITLSIYFVLNKWKLIRASIFWLILVSLVYYGCWNPKYVLLIVGIVLFNYTMGTLLRRNREVERLKRKLLITGISGNLLLLGYFKYADFFISNFNSFSHSQVPFLHIALLWVSVFSLLHKLPTWWTPTEEKRRDTPFPSMPFLSRSFRIFSQARLSIIAR
jgi:D-alanyl-lipoteichoic acid acyltransferase DltB (MBOAT superfamily)